MGIKFAPLNVPLKRRLQTLAVLAFIMGPIVWAASFIIILAVMRSDYYLLGFGYMMIVGIQRDTCGLGNRSWSWVRRWSWFKYVQAYFPLTLVKTTDLDPNKNYLFCSFPHGFLCVGVSSCFLPEGLIFDEKFPKMKAHFSVLGGHFLVPFVREYMSWLGMTSSSPEALNYLLDKRNGTGKCVVLAVGGSAESLYARPGLNTLVLGNRKGFVKIAMKNGAPLVPVYSFGETDLYDQLPNPEGSLTRRWQEWARKKMGLAPVWPLGRGFFQYSFGVIPQRRPITVVVGRPLEVERNLDPTDEQVNEVHERFVKALRELFDEHKCKYIHEESARQLIIV